MKLSWIGHASFRIDLDNGTSIVTDPFDPAVGYDMPVRAADIVTMSHNHHDHNHIGALAPKHVLREAQSCALCGARIEGYPAFHDDAAGSRRGGNVIFSIEADGARIVHLGDLGHDLSDEQISRFGAVDVLLIPVGGVYTIDAGQAAALARRIGARVTVPMHFRTEKLRFELGAVEPFLEAMCQPCAHADALDPREENAPVVVMPYGKGL